MVVFKLRPHIMAATRSCDVSYTERSHQAVSLSGKRASRFFQRRVRRLFLAFCWLAGLLCGLGFYPLVGSTLVPWMRGCFSVSVSIRSVLCVTLFPFLLSALAVFFSRPSFLYPIAFAKAFLLALMGLAVGQGWGSAGWLVRWLLCFGSVATCPLLYWYWLRSLTDCDGAFYRTALLLSAAAVVGSFHYFIIVPMAARLIHS